MKGSIYSPSLTFYLIPQSHFSSRSVALTEFFIQIFVTLLWEQKLALQLQRPVRSSIVFHRIDKRILRPDPEIEIVFKWQADNIANRGDRLLPPGARS
jgi:hypothetical protein